MKMSKNPWRTYTFQILFVSAIIGFSCACVIWAFIDSYDDDYRLYAGVITFVLSGAVTWAVFKSFGNFKRTAVVRFVMTDEATARRVVANVLSSKTWPFKQTEKGFQLDTVTIRIGAADDGRGIHGAVVAIGPYRGNNRLLIDSLKEKIDEAFLPRGLEQ